MNLHLTNRNVCPPDGFRYVFPEDGYTCHAWTWNDLVDAAGKHCQVNGYEIPDLQERMETQICMTLPPDWCNYSMRDMPRVLTSLAWGDVQNAVHTFIRWLTSGRKHVTPEEAERRALICTRCYLNVPISGCAACQTLVKEAVQHLHTRYDSSLRGCAVCKCVLQAKVHFPMDLLDKELPGVQEAYPEHCWLKRDGPNYG